MTRNWKNWARTAAATALAGMLCCAAGGEDRQPIKVKPKSNKVKQVQHTDEEIFDSQLVDKPFQGSADCTTIGTPSATCTPQSPYDSTSPSAMQPSPAQSAQAAEAFDFSQGMGGATVAARVPGMMGDFFGPGYTTCTVNNPFPGFNGTAYCPDGGSAGILKLAENSSPIPQDRLFVNYNQFTNVSLNNLPGINVNRVTPGFEKTFFDGLASFELRMPFASTLDSDTVVGSSNKEVEFGNVTATLKSYIYNDSRLALTSGFGLALPTADAVTVQLPNATEAARFDNDAVRLMPFLGGLYTPDDRFFVQSILQVDTPLNGNRVFVNPDPTNAFGLSGMQSVGIYTPQTYLYFDTAFGYWIYNNFEPGARLSGLAGMFEVHYNASLNKSDQFTTPVGVGSATIGQRGTFNQVNLLIGATAEFMQSSNLQLGYATTVGGDQVFDGELRCNYTYYFGRNLYGRSYRAGGI